MSEFVAASPWARSQFGLVASEVGRRVVQALGEAQVIGSRTQKASGLRHRYPYGSTWISKFDLLVRHLEDLPGSAVVEVPKAVYRLVEINGRILIPFVLARSLAEIPQRARLTSDVLRAEAATTVPRPPEPDALFDLGDTGLSLPRQRECSGGDKPSPVFIGVICNAANDDLLAVMWGNADTIDARGVMEWRPEYVLAPSGDHHQGDFRSAEGINVARSA